MTKAQHVYSYVKYNNFDPYHQTGSSPRINLAASHHTLNVQIVEKNSQTPNFGTVNDVVVDLRNRAAFLRAELEKIENFLHGAKHCQNIDCTGGKL